MIMIAGGREVNKEYYRFNLIPLGKDAEASFFVGFTVKDLLFCR
ncbi:hypothetical protein FLAT13_03120 [Flavobacterium salmonis]|uniref:Uncharacterized protein n=1 Tax=Flavobacterium salmonis TaxID=2654844 RepID=A0A6V6Z2Q8_9FLAO|nr:hypothetical protein FLAT13_03120 [Flavobacterium salmonis]